MSLIVHMPFRPSFLTSLVLVGAGMSIPSLSRADDILFRSGPARVALIELFTSEGCSSCPPAEKWLGDLRPSPALWREFVPVAFHVNYWDHLGWRDPLAAKAFTDRQHDYATAWNANSVYTPCFVRDGAEWRPNGTPAGDRGAAGDLVVRWRSETRETVVEFTASTTSKPPAAMEAYVALLGGGIVSEVRKGENAGRRLQQEFAVLRLAVQPLVRGQNGAWSAKVAVPQERGISPPRLALAAWVTPKGRLAPLQAVGGWLTSPAAGVR